MLVREKVFDHIIEKYYSREYGARNISRALKSELLEKIAGLSLGKEWHDAQAIVCDMKKRQIDIRLEELNTSSEEKVVLMEKCDGK